MLYYNELMYNFIKSHLEFQVATMSDYSCPVTESGDMIDEVMFSLYLARETPFCCYANISSIA